MNDRLEQQYKQVLQLIEDCTCDSLLSACTILDFNYNNLYHYIKKYHCEFECSRAGNGSKQLCAQNRHRKLSDDDLPTIKQMYYDQHLTMKQIAQHFGCSLSAICLFFSKHNLIARTKSENSKYVYQNNQQYREYVKQRNTRTYLNRRTKGTKPERDFAAFCQANNIEYIEQYRTVGNSHPYDFFLPDYNLLVEIDGTYWHSKPAQKIKDQQHVERAIEKGYNIVRIDTTELASKKGNYWLWLMKSKPPTSNQ